MGKPLLADYGVSISELKKNPSAVIAEAEGGAVAILNRNVPAAYLVPADTWEELLEQLDDAELSKIVKSRQHEVGFDVRIEGLLDLP